MTAQAKQFRSAARDVKQNFCWQYWKTIILVVLVVAVIGVVLWLIFVRTVIVVLCVVWILVVIVCCVCFVWARRSPQAAHLPLLVPLLDIHFILDWSDFAELSFFLFLFFFFFFCRVSTR